MSAGGSKNWLPLVEKIKYKISAAFKITLFISKILSEILFRKPLKKTYQ
jgi:hypothetical protein